VSIAVIPPFFFPRERQHPLSAVACAGDDGDGDDKRTCEEAKMDLEEQKLIWQKEQLLIASQVEVLPDQTSQEHTTIVQHGERFQSVPLLLTSEEKPVYYGGVDVSLPNTNTNIDQTSSENQQGKNGGKNSNADEPPSVAVYVILEYPSGNVVYQDYEYFSLEIPYIPSYLGFREIDPLERLIHKQLQDRPEWTPQSILVDGNGVLHPRKAGIACFVGVRTGIPTIGVGKTLFYEGKLNKEVVYQGIESSLHVATQVFLSNKIKKEDAAVSSNNNNNVVILDQQSIPGYTCQSSTDNKSSTKDNNKKCDDDQEEVVLDRGKLVQEMSSVCRGFAVPLAGENGEILACALVGHGGQIKSRASTAAARGGTKNPIYISVGHKVSLLDSVRTCVSLSFAKIPEPVRQADLIGRELLRCKELGK
jgi:deoxyinosine 3'endonuclease (endonuclease V)